jgi:hypothetical protein
MSSQRPKHLVYPQTIPSLGEKADTLGEDIRCIFFFFLLDICMNQEDSCFLRWIRISDDLKIYHLAFWKLELLGECHYLLDVMLRLHQSLFQHQLHITYSSLSSPFWRYAVCSMRVGQWGMTLVFSVPQLPLNCSESLLVLM